MVHSIPTVKLLNDSALCNYLTANFLVSDSVICTGNCLDYFDSSYYNPTSWNWYFEGGTPSYSTLQNPSNICYYTPGQFDVKLVVSNQYYSDSLIINDYITVLSSPEINLGNDTLLCQDDSLILSAGGGFTSYIWNTGSTDSTIIIDSSGTYWVEVMNEFGCSAIDSILVEIYSMAFEKLELGPDSIFCPGENFLLNAGSGYTLYQWQDGSSDSAFLVWEEGLYWVMATNVCGVSSDSVFVSIKQLPWVFIGNDTILAVNSHIELNAGAGFESYSWSDGSELQTITISEAGLYWVNVFDGICYNTDTINIEPIECDLFIPIVFTPNWDGANDYFYAESSKDITDFQLTVFSRWGEKIWETQNKDGKWDGLRNGRKAAEGPYFWVLSYKCIASPVQFEKKGSVTLLR